MVPTPLRYEPSPGTKLYLADPLAVFGTREFEWEGTNLHERYLMWGLVYDNEKDAQALTDAIWETLDNLQRERLT